MIIPWGKYHNKHPPMGVSDSPDIFHQKMNDLFQGFEFILECIYDLLILTKMNWTDHVPKLEPNLNKLK